MRMYVSAQLTTWSMLPLRRSCILTESRTHTHTHTHTHTGNHTTEPAIRPSAEHDAFGQDGALLDHHDQAL